MLVGKVLGANPELGKAGLCYRVTNDPSDVPAGTVPAKEIEKALGAGARLVGATVFKLAKLEPSAGEPPFDALIVDEASQVCLPNLVAIAHVAKSIVLLGDPCQLDQPAQAAHAFGCEQSALAWALGSDATMPADRGIFLPTTHRLQPEVCAFVSECVYEGRLQAAPETKGNRVEVRGAGPHSLVTKEAGLLFVGVEHQGNALESPEEAEVVARLVRELVGASAQIRGATRALTEADILVVAPYNLQRLRLQRDLPAGVRVGTIDKFQGQEAPVIIVSMTASSGENITRGIDFLLSRNRMNVALTRSQCLSIVVGSPALGSLPCTNFAVVRLVNLFCGLMGFEGAGEGKLGQSGTGRKKHA